MQLYEQNKIAPAKNYDKHMVRLRKHYLLTQSISQCKHPGARINNGTWLGSFIALDVFV